MRVLPYFYNVQLIKAIITITRLPNTLFIVFAQLLCSFCVVLPFVQKHQLPQHLSTVEHFLLAMSTGFIAAAGYMINDYFDLRTDSINKPKRVTVERSFARRKIIVAHTVLSAIGFFIGLYCAYKAKHISLGLVQLASITLLVAYSSTLKQQAFIGNITIAFLAFCNAILPSLVEHAYWRPAQVSELFRYNHLSLASVSFLGVFAFMITWIREIIKDVEDLKGDQMAGCTTLPIKYGINAARTWCYVLTILLSIYGAAYVWGIRVSITKLDMYSVLFSVLILLPLLLLLAQLRVAHTSKDFKRCSKLVKVITFVGILLIAIM